MASPPLLAFCFSSFSLDDLDQFDQVFWRAISGQVNSWRKKVIGIPSTNLEKLQPNKAPFLYNFSPSVVPPPLDWHEWIHVTGRSSVLVLFRSFSFFLFLGLE